MERHMRRGREKKKRGEERGGRGGKRGCVERKKKELEEEKEEERKGNGRIVYRARPSSLSGSEMVWPDLEVGLA